MKRETMVWFWLFSATYLFIYLSNRLDYHFQGFIQYYLNDLLAVPIVATLGLGFMKLGLQQEDFVLKKWHLIYIVALFGLVFELLLPIYMKRYTGDILDVCMYTIGGLFFLKKMNR